MSQVMNMAAEMFNGIVPVKSLRGQFTNCFSLKLDADELDHVLLIAFISLLTIGVIMWRHHPSVLLTETFQTRFIICSANWYLSSSDYLPPWPCLISAWCSGKSPAWRY